MRQLIKHLPCEDIIYFGDTARIPYGGKSKETIQRYAIENAIFLIKKNIKLLVVACNTADAQALDSLQQLFTIPIIGVITPSIELAIAATKNQHIAVLGTNGTIQSGIYQKGILQRLPGAKIVPVACPLLVHIVEERYIHHPVSTMLVEEYLHPLKRENIDTVILGCTHYPLLAPVFQEVMGPHIHFIDSGEACAHRVSEQLHSLNLCTPKSAKGRHQYFVSDDPEKFQLAGQTFLGTSIDSVQLVRHPL